MTFGHGTSDFGQLQLEVSEEVRCSPRMPMGLSPFPGDLCPLKSGPSPH